MSTRTYTLDPNAALAANSGGKRITETGPYVGKITQAWAEKNDNGTDVVCLTFESDAGQEVGPVSLYTHKSNGEALPDWNLLCSIMVCLKIRGLKPVPGTIKVYDQGKEVQKAKDILPELTNKPIGLLLRQEEFIKTRGEQQGQKGTMMYIFGAFEAGTRLMAPEILKRQTEPKTYERDVAYMEANPVKPLRQGARQRAAAPNAGMGGASTAGGFADDFVDDDIPF